VDIPNQTRQDRFSATDWNPQNRFQWWQPTASFTVNGQLGAPAMVKRADPHDQEGSSTMGNGKIIPLQR